jgi:hypothetical protein
MAEGKLMAKIPLGVIKAIDELYRLRNEIKLIEAEEKEMADTVKRYMVEHDLDSIEGRKAEAQLTMKELREIDPEAYFDALDGDTDKFISSVKVRVEANKKKDQAGANSFLGQEELNSICSITEVASLSVKKLKSVVISTGTLTQKRPATKRAAAG